MATMTGTSSSCMGRISIDGNSTSCLTLDTRAHLAGEFQILPGLALFGRRTQQIGRVIGDDQWHLRDPEAVHLPSESAQSRIRSQQVLRRYASNGQHDLRLEQRDLLFKEGQ